MCNEINSISKIKFLGGYAKQSWIPLYTKIEMRFQVSFYSTNTKCAHLF